VIMSGKANISGNTKFSITAPIGSVSFASVDSCDASDFSGATDTSMGCTTGAVTAGDTLVIASYNETFTTYTDSAGGTITQIVSPTSWDEGYSAWQVYCLSNASAGTHTITLSGGSGTYVGMIVVGFHGGNSTNSCTPLATVSSGSTTGTTVSAGAVTTTIANSAVLGLFEDSSSPFTTESGWTQVASPNADFGVEYELAPTAGSFTPTFTLSPADYWVATTVVVHP
jgi:subtilase-type serine protease